jgi:hypothetical protein
MRASKGILQCKVLILAHYFFMESCFLKHKTLIFNAFGFLKNEKKFLKKIKKSLRHHVSKAFERMVWMIGRLVGWMIFLDVVYFFPKKALGLPP